MTRCDEHQERDATLNCSKCEKDICVDCVGDDSIGIKCKTCTVLLRNPLYEIPKARLTVALGLCILSVPVIITCWMVASIYVPHSVPIEIERVSIPLILGWGVSLGLCRVLKWKRSQVVFSLGSFAIVVSYVGMLLLGLSPMILWDFIGIGVAILIMRLRLL